MQGYIINYNQVKNEDLIVTILTSDRVLPMYRFYGARHSHINIGYKLDFESKLSIKSTMPQLSNVLHLASKWNLDYNRMHIWQTFIKLFFFHLRDVDHVSDFYFNLLEKSSTIWEIQNPKRVAIESYVRLLEYEGRLHNEFICFSCEEPINKDLSLTRGFLPAHRKCVWTDSFASSEIKELFNRKSSLFLSDKSIERLWKIMTEGF